MKLDLRPGVTNPDLWHPERPSKNEWERIRLQVLERDLHSCQFCGHTAKKWMNVHHINETDANNIENLITCCVACHAVLHIGRNLSLGTIEIWESDISQIEIIKKTRDGIKNGISLLGINKRFSLRKGKYEPKSVQWANSLLKNIKNESRASLPEPLCVIFTNLNRWQIE